MDIYIDESGHAARLYEGESGGPRYFVISAVAAADPSRLANVAVDTMKTHDIKNELKHNKSTDLVRRRFAENFSAAAEDVYIEAFTVAIDRKSIPEGESFPIYKIASVFCSLLLDDLDQKGPLNIYLDRAWTKSQKRKELNKVMEDSLEEGCQGFYNINFEHVNSKSEKNIQVADMIAGFCREYIENDQKGVHFDEYLKEHVKLRLDPVGSTLLEKLSQVL